MLKNKVLIVILIVIFVGILLGIQQMLKAQNTDVAKEREENTMVLDVTSSNFEEEVLKSGKPVLVDFYADWCGPCKMLSPIVEEIAKEIDSVKVCRINIDENEGLAVEYGIMSIPTLIVFKNGEVANQTVGVVGKSDILEMIK